MTLTYKKVDYLKQETTIYIYGLGTEPMYDEVYSNANLISPVQRNSYFKVGSIRVASEEGLSHELTYYYVDHLGSPRIVCKGSTGICQTLEYAPFGESYGDIDTRYLFTGKEDEGDIVGLQYFNARYYSPELGRFISEDTVKDGVNWYVYCGNNPIQNVDPDGEKARTAYVYKSRKLVGTIDWNEYLKAKKDHNSIVTFVNAAIGFIGESTGVTLILASSTGGGVLILFGGLSLLSAFVNDLEGNTFDTIANNVSSCVSFTLIKAKDHEAGNVRYQIIVYDESGNSKMFKISQEVFEKLLEDSQGGTYEEINLLP